MKSAKIVTVVLISLLFLFSANSASALLLDFEDMPDLTLVNDYYAADGIHFNNAISLTAGFSLNEFDFPPSSGDVAIGDDYAPLEITFDRTVQSFSANFTYDAMLTFTAYDVAGQFVDIYSTSTFSNIGTSENISLDFSAFSSIVIAGQWYGSFIIDDLNFELTPVPEPATIVLFLSGLCGGALVRRKNQQV